MCTCIYIYIYMYTYMYIYRYVYELSYECTDVFDTRSLAWHPRQGHLEHERRDSMPCTTRFKTVYMTYKTRHKIR